MYNNLLDFQVSSLSAPYHQIAAASNFCTAGQKKVKPLLASHCFRYYAPELEDRVDDTDDDLHIYCLCILGSTSPWWAGWWWWLWRHACTFWAVSPPDWVGGPTVPKELVSRAETDRGIVWKSELLFAWTSLSCRLNEIQDSDKQAATNKASSARLLQSVSQKHFPCWQILPLRLLIVCKPDNFSFVRD